MLYVYIHYNHYSVYVLNCDNYLLKFATDWCL